jgi:ABC-type lipoprotein export system ATPase subunit
VLRVEELHKTFRGPAGRKVVVLAGVSLAVTAGEFVAVRGDSGCGKTTLLLSAAGLLRPDSGHVSIGGESVYDLNPGGRARLRAGKVGMVFQQFHLVEYLSVLDNVLCPTLAMEQADSRRRAGELIDRLGLSHRAGHVPAQLSIGERQRVALARAMLNRPSLLLADEPTGNLDERNGMVIADCLAEFARDGGAVLMVTHDPAATARAGRVLLLKNGCANEQQSVTK